MNRPKHTPPERAIQQILCPEKWYEGPLGVSKNYFVQI